MDGYMSHWLMTLGGAGVLLLVALYQRWKIRRAERAALEEK